MSAILSQCVEMATESALELRTWRPDLNITEVRMTWMFDPMDGFESYAMIDLWFCQGTTAY